MSPGVELVEFGDEAALLERFLEFPAALHAADADWVPDPAERRWLMAVSQRNFLALEAGRVRGRLSVMINPGLCDSASRPYGQIGFFDCVDDAATAGRLVEAGLDWLRANESTITTVLAPMNFDTWHAYRLRTGGFEQPTFLMEPWNPRYYPELFAALGFQPAAEYVTKSVNAAAALVAAWESYHRQALQAGYTFRSFDPACAAEEISLIYRLSLEIFRENLFFAEIPEAEFRALYAGAAGKLDPDLLVFVHDPDGLPAGFAFAVLDHRFPDTANLKTMGVLPGLNGRGLGAALACEIYSRFPGRGVRRVNHCLMRRGNRADQFDRGLAEVTREYALYSRPLRP